MSFRRFLMDSIHTILYFLVWLIIINLVLFSSNQISMALLDILYMDVLVLATSIGFLLLCFVRKKRLYQGVEEALLKGALPNIEEIPNESYELKIIKEIVRRQEQEHLNKLQESKAQLEGLRDYITKWVHEIKIPIAVCELISERLEHFEEIEESGRFSKDLRLELERLKFLADQVLHASRAASFETDMQVEEINLAKLVKEAVKRNAAFFISKNISVTLGSIDYDVLTDKKWISYILNQILHNSYKYVEAGASIDIGGEVHEKQILLKIRDNGIGIQSKDLNRVFDRGFTGDNGRRTSKSTGMGLYLSKLAADKLGHELLVKSQPGEYTEFNLIFYKLNDYLKVTKM